MRTLNLRFLAIILVAAALLSGGFHLLHSLQVESSASALLREADAALAAERRADSINFLSRYVELVPEDNEALARLGMELADAGVTGKAYFRLDQALRRDPARDDVRRKLVTLGIDMGRFQDALSHLETLLAEFPEDGELHGLKARCLTLSGEHADAVRWYLSSIELAPDRIDSYAELAGMLVTHTDELADLLKNEFDSKKPLVVALNLLDRMVSANKNEANAWRIRGQWRLSYADNAAIAPALGLEETSSQEVRDRVLQMAAEDASEAMELAAEDDPSPALLAARIARAQQDYVRAAEVLEATREKFPKFAAVYLQLADVAMASGDSLDAVKWLKGGTQAVPNDATLRWNLASLLIETRRSDETPTEVDEKASSQVSNTTERLQEAEAQIQWLRDSDFPNPQVAYLEARLSVAREQWLQAVQQFNGIRPRLAEYPDLAKQADFWLGLCHRQLGNSDEQLTSYRRAVETDAQWIPARLGVASALMSLGRMEEALEEYRNISALPNAPGMAPLYVARLLILSNFNRSREQRDWRAVEQVLSRAEQQTPDAPDIPILRAEILASEGQIQEAETLLTEARQKTPDEVALPLTLVALAQREQKWNEADRLLKEAEEQFGDSVDIRLARARLAIVSGADDAAEQLEEAARFPDSFSEAEKIQLAAGAASLALALAGNDADEEGQHASYRLAIDLCQFVADHDINNLRIRLLLFDLAFREGRTEDMQQILDEVHRIEGDGPLWRYGESVRLSVEAEKTENPSLLANALEHLQQAERVRPAWSRIPLLAAQIHTRQGDLDQAIRSYRRAIELGERSPTVIQRTVQLLIDKQQFAEADRVIRMLQEQQSAFSSNLATLGSQLSLRLEDFDRALELAQQAARNSEEYRDHLWLGQVLLVQDRPKEAEVALRRAVELGRDAPATWAGLIGLLGQNNRIEEARKEIEAAQQHLGPEAAAVTVPQLYALIGDNDVAQARYEEALQQHADSPALARAAADFYMRTGRIPQAEIQLQRIVDSGLDGQSNELNWARRSLALLLSRKGGYQNYLKAVALIDQNLKAEMARSADKRTKALILATRSQSAERQEAIRLIEGLLRDPQAATEADQALLAQLYLQENDWPQARKHLAALIAAAPKELDYLETYVEALILKRETSEARIYLRRLQQLAPKSRTTIELQAALLYAEGGFGKKPEEGKSTTSDQAALADKQRQRKFQELLTLLENADKLVDDSSVDAGVSAGAKNEVTSAATSATPSASDKPASPSKPQVSAAEWQARQFERYALRLADAHPELAAQFSKKAREIYAGLAKAEGETRLTLARYHARQREFEIALQLLESDWKKAPLEEVAQTALVIIVNAGNDKDLLLRLDAFLKEFAEYHENPAGIVVVQADIATWLADYETAEALYRDVLAKDENSIVALNNLAILVGVIDKRDAEATQLIEKAIRLAGPLPELLDSRAMVHLSAGRAKPAFNDLLLANEQSPSASKQFHLAQAAYATGQRDLARTAFEKALQMGLSPDRMQPFEQEEFRKFQRFAGQ